MFVSRSEKSLKQVQKHINDLLISAVFVTFENFCTVATILALINTLPINFTASQVSIAAIN